MKKMEQLLAEKLLKISADKFVLNSIIFCNFAQINSFVSVVFLKDFARLA